jgi:hypothetical protein
MIRRPLLIVAVLVLVIGIAVNGGWYYARYLALEAVDDWVAAQRAQGVAFAWTGREVTGWPLRLDGLFVAPRAAMVTPNRRLTWRGPDAALRFYLLAPDTIDLAAPGHHTLRIEQGDTQTDLALDAGDLVARAELAPGGLFRTLSAGGTDLRLAGPEDAPLASARAVQIFWEQPPAREPAPGNLPASLRVAVRADALEFAPGVLPAVPVPILGNEIAVVRTSLTVNGAIDPYADVPEALAAWRDAGGTIDVERFEIAWGPVRMIAEGTAALDPDLQPEGAFTARVSGLAKLLTAMENARMIDARTAAIARITLAVLTRPAENGGPPEARVPLTIQNGQLSVGPVALLKLPTIVWR